MSIELVLWVALVVAILAFWVGFMWGRATAFRITAAPVAVLKQIGEQYGIESKQGENAKQFRDRFRETIRKGFGS